MAGRGALSRPFGQGRAKQLSFRRCDAGKDSVPDEIIGFDQERCRPGRRTERDMGPCDGERRQGLADRGAPGAGALGYGDAGLEIPGVVQRGAVAAVDPETDVVAGKSRGGEVRCPAPMRERAFEVAAGTQADGFVGEAESLRFVGIFNRLGQYLTLPGMIALAR